MATISRNNNYSQEPIAVPSCSATNVRKNYGGVKALDRVDLKVYPGTIHAIVGENGAGKSTLMKILSGAEKMDSGAVCINGEAVYLSNVKEANEKGIAIVFQELNLFPDLDVLANIFLLREPLKFGLISRVEMRKLVQPVFEELNLEVDLNVPVSTLRLDERQLVEIAKALFYRSNILILDEPNSALNAKESGRLFSVIRRLRDSGVAVIYVSHRLTEVFAIADLITVMRDGKIVKTVKTKYTTIPEIVSLMIGGSKEKIIHKKGLCQIDRLGKALELQKVSVKGKISEIDLKVYPGEIVGLAGLEGSGVETIFNVIYGQVHHDQGKIILPGELPFPRGISKVVHSGIAYLPADRRNESVMLQQNVLENLSQVTAGTLGQYGFWLNKKDLQQNGLSRCKTLNIIMESLDTPLHNLSGGNQQKVALGKWLEANPKVFLLNDPTRGVDVGVKVAIYKIIQDLAKDNRIVLFYSSEIPEYLYVCDRVLVFYEGRICNELNRDLLTEQRILEIMNTGIYNGI
ncbi:MAG: sugar ABC transporter ATP-binding protein [Pelolinea sp.]|nr:sugar ABC transporter ATP-binding protein [Pelolinea sp.]